jgi:hypothetical protein
MPFPSLQENGMPFYRVWYQNKTEPFEFSTAGISREEAIVERILARENIAAAETGANAPSLSELIAKNNLGPVRYTEDESEPQTIV